MAAENLELSAPAVGAASNISWAIFFGKFTNTAMLVFDSLTKDLVTVEKLPYNFYKVTVKYGFKDEPDLPKDLALCVKNGVNIDPMNSSYFIGKEILLATPKDNMNYWRKKLFIGLFRSAETITNQFKLPPIRVVELGSQVLF